MANSDDLIDFNVIESHKENIQALPSGRSAKALAQIYSPPLLGANPSPMIQNDANVAARRAFEKELQNIDEADDPLDVYDRYVKWTLDAYPSAQATPQSQLLPLLERATKAFQTSTHYKNDPRYLKLWLHYIRLFSDAPREVFVFLSRQDIGVNLALYYEEFAAWLENEGRWNQAEEVYQLGLDKEARPAERLLRKYGEFQRRDQARERNPAEPTSPALPKARPALAAKIDPFASASPIPAQQQQAAPTASKKSKATKMAIFSDAEEPARPDSANSSKGWDNIGSRAERKKENTMEARPWAGETLKVGKTNGGVPKMMVFKDECVPNPKTGRIECVFVNLDAIYPRNAAVEYCFEELRARHRGLLNRDWSREARTHYSSSSPKASIIQTPEAQPRSTEVGPSIQTDVEVGEQTVSRPKQRGFQIFEDTLDQKKLEKPSDKEEEVLVESFAQTLALNDENDENAPPSSKQDAISKQEAALAKKMRKEERANRTRKIQVMDVKHIKNETKTIQINLDSPTGPKARRKRPAGRAEPTMTINTKEAMDEIYGIFSQPLPSQADQTDGEDEDSNEESDEEDDDEDDYTTGDESTATGKLSAAASEYGDETRHELIEAQKSTAADDDARTNVSNWSDFTTSKHMPKDGEDSSAPGSMQSTSWDESQDPSGEPFPTAEDPAPSDDDEPRTRYVPVPPDGYEHPYGQYRDPAVVANNRLPFMTPIVEQTESSLGAATTKTENSYYSVKTPSRKTGAPVNLTDEDLQSSPFQEITSDIAEEKRKILQPIRTKSTKGTIALGQGSVKSQIAARTQRPLTAECQQKGPIIRDLQCNPMDPTIRQTILSEINPSLASFEGYHEHLDVTSGRSVEIKKFVRAQSKAGKSSTSLDKTAQNMPPQPVLTLDGAHGTYTVKRELGAGTFAPVYLIENSAAIAAEEADDENAVNTRIGKATFRRPLEAVKMEEPASTWEFYMLRQCHRRLGVSRAAGSIVRAHEMHLFRDECFLVEDFRDQGTLLDLVNIARAEGSNNGGGMEEMLAMWLTVELLRTVEALHAKQLIHGDLKGDNVLVRFTDPGPETDWSPTYFASGAHGWAAKGLSLIDLGRGIDMRAFGPDVAFIADWPTTAADCAEMRELRPWTYQIDYHGLAGVLHSLLFAKYMDPVADQKVGAAPLGGAPRTYRIRDPLKRYWQTDLWADAFDMLLNPLAHVAGEDGGRMPLLKGLRGLRERMEGWIEENCERGVGLKGMVVRMEAAIRERKRKTGRLA